METYFWVRGQYGVISFAMGPYSTFEGAVEIAVEHAASIMAATYPQKVARMIWTVNEETLINGEWVIVHAPVSMKDDQPQHSNNS